MNVYIFGKVFEFYDEIWNQFLLAPFSFFVMLKSIRHVIIIKIGFFFQNEMCFPLPVRKKINKKIFVKKIFDKKFFVNFLSDW